MTVNHDRFFDAEHLGIALAAGRIGMWSWDALTDAVTWDDAMYERFGLSPDAAVGSFDDYLQRLHPDDRDVAISAVSAAREDSGDFSFEHRTIWPDGSVHWIEGRGRCVFDEAGKFLGMVGIGVDIDDRKRVAEIQLEAETLRANAELVVEIGRAHV